MKLYEIAEEFKALEELAESVDTEQDSEAFESLWIDLKGTLDNKVTAYCMVLKNLDAEAEACRTEADRLTKRARAIEGNRAKIKANLDHNLELIGMPKVKTALFSVAKQRVKGGLKITGDVPNEYTILRTEPDNSKIREALKTTKLDFAIIEEKEAYVIR